MGDEVAVCEGNWVNLIIPSGYEVGCAGEGEARWRVGGDRSFEHEEAVEEGEVG